MHESQQVDDIDTHILANSVHQNYFDLSIVHGSGQEYQPHQSQDDGKVLFDAPQDDLDAASLSKICCAIMIHSDKLVLELCEECVDFKHFQGAQILTHQVTVVIDE